MSQGSKTVYLETMGCQMNVLDSELVLGQLRQLGYDPVDDMHAADVVLLNTCSVREHAEEKVYSRLGQLKHTKKTRPEIVLGVIGCMAERDSAGIVDRTPHVDLICGPGQLNHIPSLIDDVMVNRHRAVSLASMHSRKDMPAERGLLAYDSLEALDLARDPGHGASVLQSYVRVQRGCDKFCTFCVVPFTRGPEVSRAPQALVDEAAMLVDRGAREITLLGQTVNSYVHRENGVDVPFSELLTRMQDINGLERIRFVTSYPGDFGQDILDAMRDLSKVCEYLHIPAQSGSNTVLRRMKRQYSVESYLDLIHRAKETVPGLQLAGDFIVGFCGESDAEFDQTISLVQEVRYKNIFCFKYSQRPGTAAVRNLRDDVPNAVKKQRNRLLLETQDAISLAHNKQQVGQRFEVLVEGYSKAALKAQDAEQSRGAEVSWRRSDQLVGRTRGDQIVVFNGDGSLIGQLISVRVVAATALTLHGVVEADHEAEAMPSSVLHVIQ